MTDERMEVERTIAADPATIFRMLCDPHGHVTIDSSGMLMDATGEPVTAVGDSFVVHMDREALNDYPMGHYDVTVNVKERALTLGACAGDKRTIIMCAKRLKVELVASRRHELQEVRTLPAGRRRVSSPTRTDFPDQQVLFSA